MNYTIETIVCGAYQENAYLLCPEGGAEAILIDPGDALGELRDAIAAGGRRLAAILLTHGHFDHLLSAQPLIEETGARLFAHAQDIPMLNDAGANAYDAGCARQRCPDALEAEPLRETLSVCGVDFQVLHTPGHTRGSVCFYDAENARLFSGDTLFCMGFGRTDLPGGSMRELRRSLREIFALPAEVRVLPGHGPDTSVGDERARYGL